MLKQILAEKVWKFSMLPQKANYYQAPQKSVEVPKMNQKCLVPHTLGEPWIPSGVPRLWECSIHLSALASMVPDCGDVSFCSVRSSLPASSIHLGQASKTPPTGCATKLLTAHPTIFHTLSTRQSSCFWSLTPPRSPRLVASPILFPSEHSEITNTPPPHPIHPLLAHNVNESRLFI